jgi:hypothetical protein
MTIPEFVKLEYDTALRKAYVTVEDKEVKKQREMWGMFPPSPLHRTIILINSRHHTSISTKPHSRRLGRPYRHFKVSRGWIQSND